MTPEREKELLKQIDLLRDQILEERELMQASINEALETIASLKKENEKLAAALDML